MNLLNVILQNPLIYNLQLAQMTLNFMSVKIIVFPFYMASDATFRFENSVTKVTLELFCCIFVLSCNVIIQRPLADILVLANVTLVSEVAVNDICVASHT